VWVLAGYFSETFTGALREGTTPQIDLGILLEILLNVKKFSEIFLHSARNVKYCRNKFYGHISGSGISDLDFRATTLHCDFLGETLQKNRAADIHL